MIQMDGGDRLRVTLLDRMSSGRSSVTTLEAILMADKNGVTTSPQPATSSMMNQSNHTHIMQREHHHRHSRDKTTAWKSLRDKLRLKRNATVWISSSTNTPTANHRDNDTHHHHQRLGFLLSNSGNSESDSVGRLRLGAVLAEERALSAREEEETRPVTTEMQPARMSLMELLEENQGQMSLVVDGGGEEEEEEEDERVSGAVAGEISCCVCMVRSKGAAFIPCGHTFCRLCSRELWVQRGNCPLCNTSILEVLDLF